MIRFILILSAIYNNIECLCEETIERRTFLWSVQNPITNSQGYLFGTIHVPYTEVWDEVSERVKEAFRISDTVLLEVNLHDDATIRRLIRCKNLKRKQNVLSYLSPILYKRIEQLMVSFRSSLTKWAIGEADKTAALHRAQQIYENITDDWKRKRPEWLLFLLYQMCENVLERATSPMLDLFLAEKAANENKVIKSIETTVEQCNPLETISDEDLLFAIEFTVTYLEKLYSNGDRAFNSKKSRSLTNLVQHYKCGSLQESVFNSNEMSRANVDASIQDRLRAQMIDKKLKDDIIIRRNSRMASRLADILERNHNSVTFSAFGTGHFFGNQSVLNHLKRRGYIINEIRDDDVIFAKPEKSLKFNSLWTRDVSLNQNSVTIEFIDDNDTNGNSSNNCIFLLSLLLLFFFNTSIHYYTF